MTRSSSCSCCCWEVSFVSVPGVEVILTTSDLCRRWMASIQELLNYLVHIQDPSHQAVHLLVQALKPTTRGIVGYDGTLSGLKDLFYDSLKHNFHLLPFLSSLFSSPVCHHLHVLQSLGDLHFVQPLLLLINPQLAGIDLAEHAVDGEGVVKPLLSEHRHLHHLGIQLLHLSHTHLHLLQRGPGEDRRGKWKNKDDVEGQTKYFIPKK